MTGSSWALAVERTEDLTLALASGAIAAAATGYTARLATGDAVAFERLYLGDEFCHHLIPTLPDLETALAWCAERRIPLTLATPPVTDEGIQDLRPLLARLQGEADAEVVANDWGTLRLLQRDYPGLKRVLGRTLRRQIKDPRAEAASATAAMTDGYAALLNQLGVAMISADRLPDGPTALPLAMHVPYEFVTSGRICSISGVPFPDPKKFLVDFSCPKPCRDFYLDLKDASIAGGMRQKGNTLYARNGGQSLLTADNAWVARWVYDLSVDKAFSLLHTTAEVRV
jgi:hypothetical protein